MHIFAYGTLMFPEVWKAVVGREFETVRGAVHGFAIYRVEHALYPGIIATEPGATVEGLLYLDVDDATLARLDAFEGDFYERKAVVVVCKDGRELRAECYVVPPAARHGLSDDPWSATDFVARGDLERFIAGYTGFGRVAHE